MPDGVVEEHAVLFDECDVLTKPLHIDLAERETV
jgi:hypothetical protein